MAAETHFRNFHQRGREWDDDLWVDLLASAEGGSFTEQAKRGTIVGSVLDLLKDDATISYLADLNLDLIVGGPPCQGFSMAGLRDPSDSRNALPWAFLQFVSMLRPKAVIIENVLGINRAFRRHFRDKSAFEQLRVALSKTEPGYTVQPVEVNARHFGVPQNRPRMMLLALRSDLTAAQRLVEQNAVTDSPWRSRDAWERAAGGMEGDGPSRLVPELGSHLWPSSTPLAQRLRPVTARDAIRDLNAYGYLLNPTSHKYEQPRYRYCKYMRGVPEAPVLELLNHDLRNHSEKTKQRFALYHYLYKAGLPGSVLAIPYSDHQADDVRSMIRNVIGSDIPRSDVNGDFWADSDEILSDAIIRLATKKHTQRVIDPNEPAPTVLTLPDDHVHMSENRVMTVRELARVQSFPDWFEFRSKATTGGASRRAEVPQYSQVGNAVPPLMAKAIGELFVELLAE